jgi:antirestriction protein ArdC
VEIGREIESHAAYLAHWVELLKESPKVLFLMLSEARQAADLICLNAAFPYQVAQDPGVRNDDGLPL